MFGEKKTVLRAIHPCRKPVSAFLLFSFLIFTFSASAKAADKRSKVLSKPAAKQTFAADVKLDDFYAESSNGVVELSWKTSFEQNTVGFRLWRDDAGGRQMVNEDLVAGSLLKVSNGLLSA